MINEFEQVSIVDNSGRSSIYLQCCNVQYDPIHQKKIQCRYKIRKDHFKNKPHTHIFGNIEDYFPQQKSYLSFQKEFFRFVAQNNISIKTASSSGMFNLLQLAFESGKNSGKSYFFEICPKLSRKCFTQRFIEFSLGVKIENIKQFHGFSSLAIDSGTIWKHNILNFVLINPDRQKLKPLLFKSIRYFQGRYISYYQATIDVIQELQKMGVIIVSIVSDNLKTQVKAVDHRDESSIMRNSNKKSLSSIIRIPCQCHCIQLAFSDFSKNH